ncbi:unnamed protein product [Allacma fusca]|uniref:G-protein coupled receptors family 1 profile domain-containing protein n=1 Tax=Allacma fusca TaxID=39272 RepID=A0A8J2P4A0_9HEXA|nr:unnamed protein product [Allacma fusca]
MDFSQARAEALYNPLEVKDGTTLKDYLPPDIVEMLHPHWHSFPPENPLVYYVLALIYVIGGLVSIFGNLLVLYIFLKYATLRTPSNMLVMNLALCDLMIMVSLIPENIVSFLMGGVWQFGDAACQIHAFCGSLFGYGQISTLVFIAYDRFNVIVRGFNATPLTFCRVMVILLFVWLYASFWAIGPMVGYGSYALDGIVASCSYGYMDQSFTNTAYILGCFVAAFILPLVIIILCYFFIVRAVCAHEKGMREQAKKMNVASLKSNDDAQKTSAEIRIAKVAIINISLWVIAWTPFAAVCLAGVLGDQKGLTPLVTSIPALFAKTSCIYNPIIYAISHPKYRQCLQQSLPWLCINEPNKDNQSTATGATKVQQEDA